MRGTLIIVVLASTLAAASAARAQTLEDRLRSQLTATTSELQDLKANQAALAAQKASGERERDALKAELAAARAALKARTPRPGPSDADLAKARSDQAAADQAQLDAAQAEARRLVQQLASLRADDERRSAELTADTEALGTCRAKHAQLTSVAQDLLAAYDHASGAAMLARREPFTGLMRVHVQNTEQTFADRLYDARLDAKPQTTPAAASPSQSK